MTSQDGGDAYAALELALRVGELMMAGGEAAETVESAMGRLTRAYGLPYGEISVTLSAITLSYLPGGGRPPVTAERRVRRRLPNYTRLVGVHALVEDAAAGRIDVQRAKYRLGDLMAQRPAYPTWALASALAMIGAGGAVLVGGGPAAAPAAFTATLLGDRAAAWLSHRGVVEFFQLVAAAAIAAAIAALLAWSALPVDIGAVVIGTVIALIPGRALVAAQQDGITGDVVTGTARLVEALYGIAAILTGIAGTLYLAQHLGVPVSIADAPAAPASLAAEQLVGAGTIAVAFAVYVLTPRSLLVPVALGGVLSWVGFVELRYQGMPVGPATLIATTVTGVLGTAYARRRGVPALLFVVASVTPLMPGTLMYRGLLALTTGHTDRGALILVEALSAALAIGAGVNLGAELVRASTRARRRLRPGARHIRG